MLGSHNEAYERVRGLMASETLFDISREPQKVRDQYGPTQFGEQAWSPAGWSKRACRSSAWHGPGGTATARTSRPIRKWSPSSTTSWRRCSTTSRARPAGEHAGDHARRVRPHAGDQPEPGPRPLRHGLERHPLRLRHQRRLRLRQDRRQRPLVVDGQVGPAELFATIYQALGIDHQKQYMLGSRPIPLTDVGTEAIREVLA